jgi:hypothetical protein
MAERVGLGVGNDQAKLLKKTRLSRSGIIASDAAGRCRAKVAQQEEVDPWLASPSPC